MRLITVKTPEGEGQKIAELAFESGIKEVSMMTSSLLKPGEGAVIQDVIDIATSTPLAKRFIESLLKAPYYDPQKYSFNLRQPESIFSSIPISKIVHPVVRPITDVYQELYQFTKITLSLTGRVFLSALLLSYGMIDNSLPIVIAGLLFLPFHHHLLGISLSFILKEWHYLKQTILALLINTLLIFLAGVIVALVCKPPVLYDIKGTMITGAVLSVITGTAAAIATLDDVGRRELIGLAASANISVYPALIGIQIIFRDYSEISHYIISFLINIAVLMGASFMVYKVAGVKGLKG